MKKPQCLLFDCDGVLIDVSESYREVIKSTVQMYFNDCLMIKDCQRPFVGDKDIESFKNAGGFNNDWELTYGLLDMFLSYIPSNKVLPIKLHNIPRIIKFLNFVGPQLKTTGNKLLAQKDVAAYLKSHKQKPASTNGSVLLFNENELYNTNLIKRLFQELYLGEKYFAKVYHRRPLLYDDTGYIEREKPFLTEKDIKQLSLDYTLGVVTGRPLKEAEIGLKKAGLWEYFSVIVAHEDIEEAEKSHLFNTGQVIKLGKPHPYGLLLAVTRLGLLADEAVAYLGDLPDDIKAANAAKASHPFISVGVGQNYTDLEETAKIFKQAKADLVINKVNEIGKMFS